MSTARRRGLLYGAGVLIAAGLLLVSFGITVPPDPGVRLNGATLLAGLGDLDEALAVCDQVLEEHPDNVDARVFRAHFLARAARYDEALAAYEDALVRIQDEQLRLDILQDRASVQLAAGHEEGFRRTRERLVAAGGEDRALLLDGMAAAKRREWAAAVAILRRAREALPDDAQVRGQLWNAYLEKGRSALATGHFPEAKEAFDAAGPLFPRASRAFLMAAEVRLAMGETDDAIRILRALGADTPGVAPLVFRAATALLERGDEAAAVDALEGAFGADFNATFALFQKETAWDGLRGDSRVRAILEMDDKDKGRLTARD